MKFCLKRTKTLSRIMAGIAMLSQIGGCADDAAIEPTGYQAVHASADGDGWRGPIRRSSDAAMSDAETYSRQHGIHGDETMVLAIYPGMNTTGRMPPNPLARRELEEPITMRSLEGYWIVTDTSPHASNLQYYLDIHLDGTCKTDFGARFVTTQPGDPDRIEVFHHSSFNIALAQGENYTFAATRYDGNTIDVLVDGHESQPMRLERADHPTKTDSGRADRTRNP